MFNIRQLFAQRLERGDGQAVSIGDRQFARLRPVRPPKHVSALNKTGRLVLYGEEGGQARKIYEAATAEHARFIEAVCSHQRLAACFPPVHSVQNRFLIVGWAENVANAPPPVEALAHLLHRIHQTPAAELPPSGFDYWLDLIKPRFARIAELLGINDLASRVTTLVSRAWDSSSRCLMHPDITPANVVLTGTGQWQSIDNELLTTGGIPLLDLCNAAYALRPNDAQKLASAYFAEAKTFVSHEDIRALNAGWLARRLGAEFVAGNLDAAHRILRSYRDGDNILPVALRSQQIAPGTHATD